MTRACPGYKNDHPRGRIRGGTRSGHRRAATRMMMGSIDRYVFRTIFGAFVLVLFNLTAVIWITQILKQIDIITNQGQTILVFLRITGLLVPILMLVIAPIAIMIAVCYALIKLNGDSELVVMNAAGISPRRVCRPVLAACVFVAVFVGFISAY